MSDQLNRVKFTTADTGTGTSLVVAARYSAAFFTPAQAGAVDGHRYTYVIQQGNDIEIQQDQIYTSSGTSIARGTPAMSIVGGTVGTTKITLDTTQVIAFGASAADLVFNQARGTDIVAAGTLNLDTATGRTVNVTGNTTITAVTLADGAERVVLFTGTPQITVGGSLVGNAGGANITVAAGDIGVFRGFASSVVRFSIVRASGQPVVPPPIIAAQGRLTLTSGVAKPTVDVAGATRLYYTPAKGGGYVPITADGATFSMVQFAEVFQDTTDTTKSPAAVIKNANYPVYAWVDSGTPRISRGDYLKLAATCTMTIASPCVVTISGATLNTNFNPPVNFSTTGALPTNVTGQLYLLPLSPTTANIATSPGGTPINATGSQSGVHTATYGDDNGLPALTIPTGTGVKLNTNSVVDASSALKGPAALRGTYVGMVASDASGLLNFTFGTTTAGGGPALLHVWNNDNREEFLCVVGDNNPTWSYLGAGTAVWRMMDNSAGNRIGILSGDPGIYEVNRGGHAVVPAVSGDFGLFGYVMDSIASADEIFQAQVETAFNKNFYESVTGDYRNVSGRHFIQAVEYAESGITMQFTGSIQAKTFKVTAWQ